MRIHNDGNVQLARAWVVAVLLALGACGGGDNGGASDPGANGDDGATANSRTMTIASDEGGELATDAGQILSVAPGTVPTGANGESGEVTFSVEAVESLPAPLPSGVEAFGSAVKFGPDGFDFAWPLVMALPLPDNASSLTGLQYMRFDPGSGQWVRYPGLAYSLDDSGAVSAVSVPAYDLGYETLALLTQEPDSATPAAKLGSECETCDGAMRWSVNDCRPDSGAPCYYYFVAQTYTPRWAWQKAAFENYLRQWYNGGDGCGWNAATARFEGTNCGVWRTGSQPVGGPAPVTLFHIMQGDWEFCVGKSQFVLAGASPPDPGQWTYSELAPMSITQASHNSCLLFSCWDNVVDITLPEGGDWRPPDDTPACPANPNPSTVVGTGHFQATLTWVNNSSRSADLDLHLYGPEGLHVFFGNPTSSDGKLQLDRDWLTEPGNAVENIFSTSSADLSRGDYRLTVHHFSGSVPIGFSVRVVRDGVASTFSHTFSGTDQEIEITRFSE